LFVDDVLGLDAIHIEDAQLAGDMCGLEATQAEDERLVDDVHGLGAEQREGGGLRLGGKQVVGGRGLGE